MSEPEITPDDTHVMRKQGDWRAYLDSEIAKGNARRAKPAVKPQAPAPPGHRPGAWPPGTRPPDPPEPIPAAEIEQALAAYRANPDEDHPCQCTACQQLTGGNR